MENIKAHNKSAAINVYADLCEVRNYANVTANYESTFGYIYFEAQTKYNDPNIEYVLPVDDHDNTFSIDFITKLINLINLNHSNAQIDRIKLAITSVEFTTVYYDLKEGVESPFTKEQLRKDNIKKD